MFYEYFEGNITRIYGPWQHGIPIDVPHWVKPYRNCIDWAFRDYVCNCHYDTAHDVFTHLLTNIPETGITELNPKIDYFWRNHGVLRQFD